jgi:hypothetical protein
MLILGMPCSKVLPNIKHGQEKNNSMILSPTKLIVIYPQLQTPIAGRNTKEIKMLATQWAFCFSKQHTPCRGEIPLDKVPLAYTKNVLLMF